MKKIRMELSMIELRRNLNKFINKPLVGETLTDFMNEIGIFSGSLGKFEPSLSFLHFYLKDNFKGNCELDLVYMDSKIYDGVWMLHGHNYSSKNIKLIKMGGINCDV